MSDTSLKDSKMITVKCVAEELGISPISVRRLIEKGEIRGYKFGGSIRVDKADLSAFRMESQIGGALAGC
ncbi:MAG: excisionase family DNA binding protein [Verrucomicrobiales bacterium]|jgi:excisionase family DNA binding protein